MVTIIFKYYIILLSSKMENISLKLEPKFARELDLLIKRNRYSTKTEFIREAMRNEMKRIEKEETLRRIDKLFGSSKRKTTDEEYEKAREEVADELERKFGFK